MLFSGAGVVELDGVVVVGEHDSVVRVSVDQAIERGEFIEDHVQQARLFRDVEELQAMVDGALAFFRGDADEEAATSFDLAGVLQTIANDYADQDIEIAYAGPSHAVYRGRPFALKRAFANLIENAVKYGTPPTIELACQEKTITIKGVDEADSSQGEVSWIAPISRALLKARVGDEVSLMTPGGLEQLEVLAVSYPAPA